MLYWIYTAILAYLSLVLIIEFVREKKWLQQVMIVLVLIPFVLRILQIK